jgi:hypothetical protein
MSDAPWIPRTLEEQFKGVTDEHLALRLDAALADLTLADRYEHNRKLVVPIQRFIDRIKAEQARRALEEQRTQLG